MADQLAAALAPVIEVLERLGVAYYIGGSVASMTHGERRETADVDIVADLANEHVPGFVEALTGSYYVDEPMIRGSIRQRISFNVIHLETMFKVDVFPLKRRSYDRQAIERRQKEDIPAEPPVHAFVAPAEDVVLAKLEWYKATGGTSDKQWRDILGVLKLQRYEIDIDYMEKWAREIRVADLLARAFDDAGFNEKEDE